MIPRATYRLQFHKDFRFEHAAALADYFATLGISHIYASPILKARAGSTHGYNVVDFTRINPELGGEGQFRAMAQALRKRDIGIIVDIVPNHMAIGQNDNAWWLDVLRNGRASAYANYFDIDWGAPGLEGKILVPFIDGAPERALERGELKLVRENGHVAFAYFDHRFPLRPEDDALPANDNLERISLKEKTTLLARQHFVLSDWRDANTRINWRRFFDITELAALRMENDATFDAVHAKTLTLYEEGLVDGLRVDHVDGLADPRAYCRKLRSCLDARESSRSRPGRAYLIVEKILAAGEALPDDWLVDGTTGYDFMEDASAVLHAPDNAGMLSRFWSETSGRSGTFEPEELLARNENLNRSFAAQRASAARAMASAGHDISKTDAQSALSAVLEQFRAYRTYATGEIGSPEPGRFFDEATARARSDAPNVDAVDRIMCDNNGNPPSVLAIRRFNQLAAPVAAKSVEDTAFYRYGRLISRNDVGSDPRIQALEIEDFHARTSARARTFPHAMLTTATHDHKRGEDARTRLALLSEIPDVWIAKARNWMASAPVDIDRGDAYQLLQTMIGAWPIGGLAEADIDGFVARISGWCRKFLREAKLRSSWISPNEDYEGRFLSFGSELIGSLSWRKDADAFVAHITPAAIANTLAQAVLRLTCPGVPDLYQGRESWDFSLVDPDNRAAVDFDALRQLQTAGSELVSNPASWRSDHCKLALVSRLLHARAHHAELFARGSYRPIAVEGPRAGHVLAFERRAGEQSMLVSVSLRCASALCGSHEIAPPSEWWGDTHLITRSDSPLRDALTETTLSDHPIAAADLFEVLPVAVMFPQ